MGLTVVDAGVIIGFLDTNDTHHGAARSALADAQSRNDRLVLPASALAEILVGPSRRGEAAVAAVRGLVDRVPIEVEPLDVEIAVAAAALRARHPTLKLPDALVIATASHLEADHLITTDRRWPSQSVLRLKVSISEISSAARSSPRADAHRESVASVSPSPSGHPRGRIPCQRHTRGLGVP